MEFIIGSKNQAKVKAAKETLAIHFPEAKIIYEEVGSGVSDQPFGEEETRLGAINRALRASSLNKGALGIGLEGGVRVLEGQMYMCNWGALVLPDGTKFTASGAQIPLPEQIASELRAGKELGPVVDRYFKATGVRNKEGAMGILTSGVVNRDVLFTHICQLLIGQLHYFHRGL